MIVIATKEKVTTRFVIGCDTRGEELAKKLRAAGYKVSIAEAVVPPKRTEEEKNRATKIVGELFGH